MTAVVLQHIVLDSWEDNDNWDFVLPALQSKQPSDAPTPVVSEPTHVIQNPVKKSTYIKNCYEMYPYFLAGIEGTIRNELFQRTEYPIRDLKKLVETSIGLLHYVRNVRNYINSMFYVLKSTKYFNPVSKTRVPPKKKGEYVDSNFQFINIQDQLKVYRLFGFQGHIGSKRDDEDVKRDELLDKLKEILYNKNVLTYLVQLLFNRIDKNEFVSRDRILNSVEQLTTTNDYNYKSYSISEQWYHGTNWQKLRYVYGGSHLDKIGGGDGAITYEMEISIRKTSAYCV